MGLLYQLPQSSNSVLPTVQWMRQINLLLKVQFFILKLLIYHFSYVVIELGDGVEITLFISICQINHIGNKGKLTVNLRAWNFSFVTSFIRELQVTTSQKIANLLGMGGTMYQFSIDNASLGLVSTWLHKKTELPPPPWGMGGAQFSYAVMISSEKGFLLTSMLFYLFI